MLRWLKRAQNQADAYEKEQKRAERLAVKLLREAREMEAEDACGVGKYRQARRLLRGQG